MTQDTEVTELEAISAELEDNYAEQSRLRERAKALQGRSETLKRAEFARSFEGGRFQKLDRDSFKELHALMHSAGQDFYRKGKELLADIHPAIAYDGGYVSTTMQPIFRLTLAPDAEVTDDMVAAVLRVSEWVSVDDEPVYWSIFDWRLSEDGIHSFFVHSEDEAEIVVTSYGCEMPEGRKPLADVLRDIARKHYYPARPGDHGEDVY